MIFFRSKTKFLKRKYFYQLLWYFTSIIELYMSFISDKRVKLKYAQFSEFTHILNFARIYPDLI